MRIWAYTIHFENRTIANPEIISQNFGDIPDAVARSVFRHSAELGVQSADEINVDKNGSNTCVAASLEYDMASTSPAEFARFAAALSSDDYMVTKTNNYKKIEKIIEKGENDNNEA